MKWKRKFRYIWECYDVWLLGWKWFICGLELEFIVNILSLKTFILKLQYFELEAKSRKYITHYRRLLPKSKDIYCLKIGVKEIM